MEEFVFEEESEIEATFQMDVASGNHQDLDGRDLPDQHPTSAITGLDDTLSGISTSLDGKVDKVSTANQVYGTDENGDQTTYDVDSFGQVDDVTVGGVSVVTNKIAELGTMAGETASDYYTKTETDEGFATAAQGALADTAIQPQDNISSLTNDVGYITASAVKDGTLTIQKNGTLVATFTANQEGDSTANLIIPTTPADIGALPDSTTINDLTTPAQQAALNSGATSTNIAQIATNTGDILTINGKIPSAATTTNQLADKDFVNSSIATNTANFIGTFNSVADLEAYSGTVTNNDYAFVINSVVTDNGNDWADLTSLNAYDKTLLTNYDYAWVINGSKFDLYRFDIVNQVWELRVQNTDKADVTLNTAYNRYKATVSGSTVTWDFEYTLNNSSFTAAQWAAINSGANNTNIGQITTNQNAIGTLTSLNTTAKTDLVSAVNEVEGVASTALQPNDNISSLTNDSGYITGITSGDVTTALGYTPADDSNVVKTTGNQTITGEKTFNNTLNMSSNKVIRLYNSANTYGEIRSNAIEFRTTAANTNGGYVDFHYAGNTGDYTSRIIEDASGQLTYLGSERFTATNAINSGVIATKGWVNNPSTATNVVHRTGDETIAGTKTFTGIVYGETPSQDTTSSMQIDTVGARNTKLQGYANTSLSNLSSDGQMVVDSQNGTISNCILEIPQNLKLEIVNNTPVMKAGSIVTFTGSTYATLTTTTDSSVGTLTNTDGEYFLTMSGIANVPGVGAYIAVNKSYSGNSSGYPTQNLDTATSYYNTDEKKWYRWTSSGWLELSRYPLAIVKRENGVWSFAKDSNGNDMIFNGAGFIGHHEFIYPSITPLCPDGYNADGTLKSVRPTTSALQIIELNFSRTNATVCLTGTATTNAHREYYEVNDTSDIDTSKAWTIWYVKNKNVLYQINNNGALFVLKETVLTTYTSSATAITDFTIRQPVRTATTEMLDNYATTTDIANMQTTTNLVTSVSSSSTDSQYPSAKLLYDTVGNIETLLNNINSGS